MREQEDMAKQSVLEEAPNMETLLGIYKQAEHNSNKILRQIDTLQSMTRDFSGYSVLKEKLNETQVQPDSLVSAFRILVENDVNRISELNQLIDELKYRIHGT